MIWQIAFWVWMVGIFVMAFIGVMATLMDPEIDETEVSWPKAALAYIFWPIAFVAVLGAVAWAKRTDARLARSLDTPCEDCPYVPDCPLRQEQCRRQRGRIQQ